MAVEREHSLEGLSHCPKCGDAGVKGNVVNLMDPDFGTPTGKKWHEFTCDNKRCVWYKKGGWGVQVNPDGSIPQALNTDQKNPLGLVAPRMTTEALKMLDEIDPDGSLRRAAGIE